VTPADTAETTRSDEPPPVPIKRPPGCPFTLPEELARLQAVRPVSRVSIWNGTQPWLVTRYDDVRTVLSDPRFSSDGRAPGYPSESAAMAEHRKSEPMMLTTDPPEHTRVRRVYARYFTIHRLEQMRPSIQGVIDELIEAMIAGPPPADLVQALAHPLPGQVVSALLGVRLADRDLFGRLVGTCIDTSSTPEASAAANREIGDYLAKLVEEKRARPGDDVISHVLVNHENDDELTRAEIVSNTRLLVFAGFETTVHQLGLGVLTLLQHPDQMAELRADPTQIPGAVEEIVRYTIMDQYPRARVALEDVEVGGQMIRAGDGVLVSLSAANRDANMFDDPGRFDIHRRDARMHMGFSFGVHQCLGQALARMEIQLALATLLTRVPTLELAVPYDELKFKPTQVMNGLVELPVTWH
jgi:cytochrome P450